MAFLSARAVRALLVAIAAFAVAATPASQPSAVAAAGCLRFSATNFNGPGNDNYELNGEWVRIKNVCASRKGIGGWKIHDYGKIHIYKFPSGASIGPGKTITLYSGRGTNTTSKRYWGRTYGAVWNDVPPEKAYLRNGSGTIIATATEY
jgi:hypothetical protein